MNRYVKLLSNTLIFAIGTFSSKLMVFLLMPLYTRVLTPADYGVMDLVVNTSNLLLPLVMVSINEAIIRFGLEKSVRKSEVFSIGLVTSLCGFLIFLCFIPVFWKIDFLSSYTTLIYLYVFAAAIHGVCAQFVRSMGLVRLYAFEGVLATLTIVLLNVLFLVVFQWGITGYVLSVILSNLISVLFLFWAARLWKFIKFRSLNRKLAREMLLYSLPLIPTTMMWWVTNVSDRYLVTYFVGEAANGLYSVSYKIPTIISIISSIFTQAWQLSAISENDQSDKDDFYSDIFQYYQTVVFLAASGIMWLLKVINYLLVSPEFFDSWKFAPFLILSVVFSCFVSFFSSFYMAAKKNIMSMVTTFLGAVSNIVLNLWLIPIYGPQGAAFATFVSYFLVFIVRAVDTRRFVRLKMDLPRLLLSFFALLGQAWVLILEPPFSFAIQLGFVLLMFLINLKSILYICYRFFAAVGSRRKAGNQPI